jgi:hypothetical protein
VNGDPSPAIRKPPVLRIFLFRSDLAGTIGNPQPSTAHLAHLTVAFGYRPLVPMFLGLALLDRLLMAVTAWVTKPSPTGHHPPEHYASLLLIPVLAVFLAMATRSRSGTVR